MAWLIFPTRLLPARLATISGLYGDHLVLPPKLKPLRRKTGRRERRRAKVVPQVKGAMLQREHYSELRLLGKQGQRRRHTSAVGTWAGLRFCL